MAGTHGDLFHEIGRLVVAADAGEPLDLATTSEELSRRYANLRVPADMMARAIARSLGAVGVSMSLVQTATNAADDFIAVAPGDGQASSADRDAEIDDQPRSASGLFPSGVRLALLS